MATLHALPLIPQRIKIKVLIISRKNVKAFLVPFFFSLQSKIVWESIQISRWLFISRNGLDSFTEDRLESRKIGDQSLSALSVSFGSHETIIAPHRGETAGSIWNSSPRAFLLPVCLLDFPSCLLEGPAIQTSGQGALGMVGAEASPHSGCTHLPSPTTFPLQPETHFMMGRNKVQILPDMKHYSRQPLPSPINFEFNTII